MAVVENTHLDDVRTASWAFPLYLVAINLFVIPVALVGLTLFPDGAVQADTFMVAIPRELGWPWLAFVAFLGGLSAATGMIIVATLAVGTMVSNDLILPALATFRGLRARWEANPGPALLMARRVAVVGIMALAYGCYLAIGPAFPLAAIGLISFAAVAQFAPALLGGMFWRAGDRGGGVRRHRRGLSRLGLVRGGARPRHRRLAAAGAPGRGPVRDRGALSPTALGGLRLDPLLHGMLWSLGPNLGSSSIVSLLTEPSAAERRQAERFVAMRAAAPGREGSARAASLADLHELAGALCRARAGGRDLPRADAGAAGRAEADERSLLARSDAEAVQVTERLLAGAIGSASARVVVASLLVGPARSRARTRAS